MFIKKVEYRDPWTGDRLTKDLYFHLTEMEVVRFLQDHPNIRAEMQHITSGNATQKEIIALFEEFASRAYGLRVPNPATGEDDFIKSESIVNALLASEPYSSMVVEFFASPKGAEEGGKFLEALLPADLVARAEAQKQAEEQAEKNVPSDQVSQERLNEMRDAQAAQRQTPQAPPLTGIDGAWENPPSQPPAPRPDGLY